MWFCIIFLEKCLETCLALQSVAFLGSYYSSSVFRIQMCMYFTFCLQHSHSQPFFFAFYLQSSKNVYEVLSMYNHNSSSVPRFFFCKDLSLVVNTKDLTEGWTDARSAVGFCLGSGLFGSYNSD